MTHSVKLTHAGRIGHTEYEEVACCRLVATPKEAG